MKSFTVLAQFDGQVQKYEAVQCNVYPGRGRTEVVLTNEIIVSFPHDRLTLASVQPTKEEEAPDENQPGLFDEEDAFDLGEYDDDVD